MRLDLFTVENGLIKSRERAKEMIKSGNVTVNGKIVTKASADVS
ncbi:MAG: TlyA family RNA methyltransferase, partial [Ruminococcus sp.]|nr:TlyA family RNA methyltransferase [Ruminococcus sp.]